ncbi:MAG: carotenoid oxygenase family protein [Halovenus sp.]
MSNAFMPGFRSLEQELTDQQLPVEGEIPSWLSGALLRNGPGLYDVGGERLRHWFDGLAMVRKYRFESGTVRYSNRFLRTESYADATAGETTGQFATDENGWRSILDWVRRLGPPEPTDNANVHLARIDGEYVAQTEVPRWVAFDPETLETDGTFTFRDTHDPDMTTAHLVADPRSGDLVGHSLSFGRTHSYDIFRIPSGTRRRERITRIETDAPAYVHSIGVSERHVVLVETPLRISIRRAFSPFTEGFFDLLDWQPERGTTFTVVERETGAVSAELETGPFFVFHTVNAFDDGGETVLDLVEFDDDAIVDALSFESLETEGFDGAPPGRFVRYRLGPDGVSREQLYDGGIELPAVARDRKTRPYRYAYGQATDREGANGLVKIDTERGQATEWWETDAYVEEPCMVQRPDGEREDDGVVIAPVLDVAAEHSWVVVFDAGTLAELGRARIPHAEPFGFHGRFFTGT